MLFAGQSELQTREERGVNSVLHWRQGNHRHYLSQTGAKDSQYKHALMPKKKWKRSKSKASFLYLLQRQWMVPFLNYLWFYLGSIYRLWSGSLLEVHSPDCINLVALSVSHMSLAPSQPEMCSTPLCDLSALLLNWGESEESLCLAFGWFRFTAASLALHTAPDMHIWKMHCDD